jgi:hypothetical protein
MCPFRAFFRPLRNGPEGNGPNLLGEGGVQAEGKMHKKLRFYCLSGPPQKQLYSGPGGQVVGRILL